MSGRPESQGNEDGRPESQGNKDGGIFIGFQKLLDLQRDVVGKIIRSKEKRKKKRN